MRRHPFVLLIGASAALLLTLSAQAQIGGAPGAYTRMGFGARGMGMGNAMTAVVGGDGGAVGLDNPALLPWGEGRVASASFGILTLGRRLNFLTFSTPLPPQAGLSAGIINSGVTGIDGRDNDGVQTGDLTTSENLGFLSFGVRTKNGLTFGVTVKILYYHLYTSMNSITAGIDLGAYYAISSDLSVGATVRDINSKYKWDSSDLYGQSGASPNDPFPILYTVGGAYRLPDSLGTVSCDFQLSDASTMVVRAGVEVPLIPELTLRAGVDRIDLKEKGNGIRPALGFSTGTVMDGWIPRLHYTFVLEPFAGGMHMITLSARF